MSTFIHTDISLPPGVSKIPPPPIRKIVLASNNKGKLAEFKDLFAPLGIEIVPQSDFKIGEAEEPHFTFIENALAKARYCAVHTGLPAIADDSGLCVEALNDRPGVNSARFAGEPRDDEHNNDNLLFTLGDEENNRRARYVCILAFIRNERDPLPLITYGEWVGEIRRERSGTGGFGYDSLFQVPELDKSAASLTAEEKNARSHRGKAARALVEKMREMNIVPQA
jgi:XTP/dITP diphosphohydrolase